MKSIFTTAGLLIAALCGAQTEAGVARVEKVNNHLVFYHNEPVQAYEQAFTFVNAIESMDCKTVAQIMQESVKNANAEAGAQSRIYDAVLVTDGERDIAIVWKDKAAQNDLARVRRVEGKYVFMGAEPVGAYEIKGKYNVSGVGQQLLLGTCPNEPEKIAKLIKQGEKNKLEFDAVIYNCAEKDLVIKLK